MPGKPAQVSNSERFEFRFAPAYRRPARMFGIRPQTAWVEVSDEHFAARFGPWRVMTPRSNINSATITGPYAYYRTAGPVRLGVTDLGLSFTCNGDRGVLLCFAASVQGIEPFGVLRHRELTVTVAEPERLAQLLAG